MPKKKVGSRQPNVVAQAHIAVPVTTGRSGLTLVLGEDGTDMMYTAGTPAITNMEADMVENDPRNDDRNAVRGNSQIDSHAATGDSIDEPVEREG